jgi:hypothetical protein
VDGAPVMIYDKSVLQRVWLSRWFDQSYVLDYIGGEGSFVYIIDTGLNVDHIVSNFFRFVGLFKGEKKDNFLTELGIQLQP